MKKESVASIQIVPEDFGTDFFDTSNLTIGQDPMLMVSEMSSVERRFINGLIRYYEPECVLEVGVSGGGGSAVLLDAISGLNTTELVSIDSDCFWYRDKNRQVGFVAMEMFPDTAKSKWNLILGKDPAMVLPSLKKRFDFVVIDTSHYHPVETLNFLTVLPFLNEGAIVVLHDISLSIVDDSNRTLAPRILWSSVVGDKLVPRQKYEPVRFNGSLGASVCNIGAFQINKDTTKYIRNVFESLMIPWEACPSSVDAMYPVLTSFYDSELVEVFRTAAGFNKVWHETGFITYSKDRLMHAYRKWQGKPVVFYGAGLNMRDLIGTYKRYNIPFDYPIWDINAENLMDIMGHKVSFPDFGTIVPYGHVAVITIQNKSIFSMVREKLENIGFIVLSIEGFSGLS